MKTTKIFLLPLYGYIVQYIIRSIQYESHEHEFNLRQSDYFTDFKDTSP